MKKYVSGLISGIIITLAVTVFAATVKQYILTPSTAKIVVNGATQTVTGQPILDYNKNTYIPASILTRAGVLKKQGSNYAIGSTTVVITPKSTTPKKSAESYLKVVGGKNLVLFSDFSSILLNKGYKLYTVDNDNVKVMKDHQQILYISNEVLKPYNGLGYVDYDFFAQYIYPLL